MKRNTINSVTFVLAAASTVPIENTATDIPRLSFRPHLSEMVLSANAPMM